MRFSKNCDDATRRIKPILLPAATAAINQEVEIREIIRMFVARRIEQTDDGKHKREQGHSFKIFISLEKHDATAVARTDFLDINRHGCIAGHFNELVWR